VSTKEEFMDILGVSSDAFFHNFLMHCDLHLLESLKKHLPDKQLAADTDVKQAASSCYRHEVNLFYAGIQT